MTESNFVFMRWRLVTCAEDVCGGRPCVAGVVTTAIRDRFAGGDSVSMLAVDYGFTAEQVEDALRWELLQERQRLSLQKRGGEHG